MANMSYCKFENTYHDLRQCQESFDDADSKSEREYRRKLIQLCEEIAHEYGEDEED